MAHKKVLVTGAGGFLGKPLVKTLARNMELIPLYHGPQTNLLSREYVDMLQKADVVIHLAGKSFVPESWKDPHTVFNTNFNTTLNMLEYARNNDVEQFIFPSSYLYGNPDYLPIDEKHPVKILNPYARSKYICEELCRSYAEEYGLSVIIFRIFNIYGPGQPGHWLIPTILSQLPSGTVTLNDTEPKRDYIYISDVISAFVCALDYRKTRFEIFNLGSGMSYSVQEIVDAAQKAAGTRCAVVNKAERRKNEIMNTIADISKASSLLGWKPAISLEYGLKEIWEQTIR